MTTATRPGTHSAQYAEEDVGNIVMLEHVNVRQPDQLTATLFYVVGLGFTRDPYMQVGLENMWVNLGQQQFHMPTGEPNVLRGHIGLVVPSLDALAQRLELVAPKLAGTQFAWSRQDGRISVTCPWGNQFRCYEPSPEYGDMQIGIPYVEFTVPIGSAEGIARFYEQGFGAPSSIADEPEGKVVRVESGLHQELRFRETASVPEYDGHHINIYVSDFSGPYTFLAERGLITGEPRNHIMRFEDIVDPESGRVLFKIEHEVRSTRHPFFHRPLVNRPIGS